MEILSTRRTGSGIDGLRTEAHVNDLGAVAVSDRSVPIPPYYVHRPDAVRGDARLVGAVAAGAQYVSRGPVLAGGESRVHDLALIAPPIHPHHVNPIEGIHRGHRVAGEAGSRAHRLRSQPGAVGKTFPMHDVPPGLGVVLPEHVERAHAVQRHARVSGQAVRGRDDLGWAPRPVGVAMGIDHPNGFRVHVALEDELDGTVRADHRRLTGHPQARVSPGSGDRNLVGSPLGGPGGGGDGEENRQEDELAGLASHGSLTTRSGFRPAPAIRAK